MLCYFKICGSREEFFVYTPDNSRLFGYYFRFAVSALTVSKKGFVTESDRAVFQALPYSEFNIKAY